jgi:hypothetical protein
LTGLGVPYEGNRGRPNLTRSRASTVVRNGD